MSRPQRVLTGPTLGAIVAVLLLTGCGSDTATTPESGGSTTGASVTSSASSDSSSEQPDAPAICDAATAFDGAVTDFQTTLAPGVTIEELRSARDEVVDTFTDLGAAAADAAGERLDAVEAAERSLRMAVDDIPDQATVTDAIDSLRDEAAELKAAVEDLVEEVSC